MVVGRVGAIFLLIFLWLVVTLYGVMLVLAKGPSPTARNMFVCSVQETSAVGFLARLFFSQAQIDAITGADAELIYEEMDTSLIVLSQQEQSGVTEDAWGLQDEDGDGIILETITGESYSGYMMVVLDPSRVILGTDPASYGRRGYTVESWVQRFDAVAGINAGGFHDPNGQGNGSIPDTLVAFEGEIYGSDTRGCREGFAGFDSEHILHVGEFTREEMVQRDIQYGVGFGPVLVVNGQMVDPALLQSGVNPRTAIGQRSDGAVLLLVIDGRQVTSLGATYQDIAELFISYGAVNACNLDGGSSSLMWYDGRYINTCASVLGVRPVPTAFLVLTEEESDD